MAHSIQVIGEKSVVLNDLDLLLLLRMMVDSVDSGAYQDTGLQQICARWRQCWETYGPGTIDLELAEISSHNSSKAKFLDLTRDIEKFLRAQPPILERSIINQRWRIKGIEFADYEVDRLIVAIEKIHALTKQE